MLQHQNIPQVGAQDPELPNSPVADEEDEDTDVVRQQVPGEPVCLFNGRAFKHGEYVASGSQVLKCSYGVWVESGSTDERNP
ncbi:MAG TPA: hypothetical protein VMT50_00810 [Steroidobacteraceae bacterium]|nr:hypothetical protein [Steroidobacteraceae bacterium]